MTCGDNGLTEGKRCISKSKRKALIKRGNTSSKEGAIKDGSVKISLEHRDLTLKMFLVNRKGECQKGSIQGQGH